MHLHETTTTIADTETNIFSSSLRKVREKEDQRETT